MYLAKKHAIANIAYNTRRDIKPKLLYFKLLYRVPTRFWAELKAENNNINENDSINTFI